MFGFRPPEFLLKWSLLGRDAGQEITRHLRDALATVPPSVLARRIETVLRVDVGEYLRAVRIPMLYLGATEDRVVGTRGLATILEMRPDVHVRTVRAPHLLLQREPAWAWDRIVEFVVRANRPHERATLVKN